MVLFFGDRDIASLVVREQHATRPVLPSPVGCCRWWATRRCNACRRTGRRNARPRSNHGLVTSPTPLSPDVCGSPWQPGSRETWKEAAAAAAKKRHRRGSRQHLFRAGTAGRHVGHIRPSGATRRRRPSRFDPSPLMNGMSVIAVVKLLNCARILCSQ